MSLPKNDIEWELHKLSTSLITYGCIIAINYKMNAFASLAFTESLLKSKFKSLTPLDDVLHELEQQILLEYPFLNEIDKYLKVK